MDQFAAAVRAEGVREFRLMSGAGHDGMAMIRIAEEANTLDQVLVKIADRIDQRIERRLEVLVRMIEPLMLVIIGAMVMFVIVGVLLPVFDLNSSVE